MRNSQKKNEVAAAAFPRLVTDYLTDLHSRRPALAAASGLHAWNGRLEDFSTEALASEAVAIHRFQERLEKIPRLELAFSDLLDYQILASNMKSRLLELEQIKTHERNPQLYADAISVGLLQLVMFEYAPLDSRLRHVIAKQKHVPTLLDGAKINLQRVPAISLKTGLDSFKGTLRFIERDLVAAFATVEDPDLQAEFRKTTKKAAKAISEFIKHLQKMKPASNTAFALGRENYEAKLLFDEGIDIGIDALLKIANRELASAQEQFRKAAAQVDRRRDAVEVWASIQSEHPKAGTLVDEAQKQVEALRRFVEEKQIVTLPEGPGPEVGATPDFLRWATASMWTPGPFEAGRSKPRYLITDVDPNWTEKQKAEHLSSFNYPQLWSTSIHEAYPGHFVQGSLLTKVESNVRKSWALAPVSFVEGWAHYTEQMMIEEGFGGGDPKLKMGQLADALLRLCRFVVGIRLHTAGMTVDEATQFFRENGYMNEAPARVEAERGTFDPGYISYSIGKLAMLKLRADYKRSRGKAFSLREFHDRVLATGMAPIWAHRQMLMPGDKGRVIE
ncbi:MAG TPA: DUF885 domain-containing protein [Blastocatellia bacterium]|nr:DUF885 domain-containing protein [Blastocatellia bacterium]